MNRRYYTIEALKKGFKIVAHWSDQADRRMANGSYKTVNVMRKATNNYCNTREQAEEQVKRLIASY